MEEMVYIFLNFYLFFSVLGGETLFINASNWGK